MTSCSQQDRSSDTPSAWEVALDQYLMNFEDLVDNVPDEMSRMMTEVHHLNASCFNLLNKIDRINSKMANESLEFKAEAVKKIEKLIRRILEIGDEKLKIGQNLVQLLEAKSRELDLDYETILLGDGIKTITFGTRSGRLWTDKKDNKIKDGNMIVNDRVECNPKISQENVSSKSKKRTKSRDSLNGKKIKYSLKQEKLSIKANNKRIKMPIPSFVTKSIKSVEKRRVGRPRKDKPNKEEGTTSDHSTHSSDAHSSAADSKPKLYKAASQKSVGSKSTSPDDSVDEELFCLCKKRSFGDMICCDNDECLVEWFHFGCVGIQSQPKGKWYCPKCRGERRNWLKKSKK